MSAAHIVLIEDNPGDVLLVQMALEESDISYEMTRFEDGEEAVNALCLPGEIADTVHPDAILLDLNTPRSDGFDVLGKLRRNPRLADVPIAIISSSHARSDKQRATLMGSVCYIEKPSQLQEFLRTVGRAVKEMLHA